MQLRTGSQLDRRTNPHTSRLAPQHGCRLRRRPAKGRTAVLSRLDRAVPGEGEMNELELFAGADRPSEQTHWKTPGYMRERARVWRLANPEYVKQYKRKNRRVAYLQESARKYGITPAWFEQQMREQGDACATCAKLFDWDDKQTKPHIDHCHATGKVRGLLCNRCNSILGLVADSPERLLSLAEYLKCHGQ